MAARTGKEFLERLDHLRNTDRSRAYALVDAILGSAS